MVSDQDYRESAMRPGTVRTDDAGQQNQVNQMNQPFQPIPFLSDGGSKFYGQTKKRDHPHAHQSRRVLRHKIKKVLFAMIPFVIFMVGLAMVSVGFFSYIENESVLAIFITSRDLGSSVGLHGVDESMSLAPNSAQPVAKETAAASPDGALTVPFYYEGDQCGQIRIPSVDIAVNVYQGDSEDELRLGAGHYNGSFFPGQDGNIVIASHRTTYFRNLENIAVGDKVEFETTYGLFTYQVREISILKNDFSAIPEDLDHEQLTLYTCYPFVYIGNAPERFVVFCDLIGSELNT